jgi:hypothetical protein
LGCGNARALAEAGAPRWWVQPLDGATSEGFVVLDAGPTKEKKGMSDYNTSIIEEFRANDGKVGGPFEAASVVLLHHDQQEA